MNIVRVGKAVEHIYEFSKVFARDVNPWICWVDCRCETPLAITKVDTSKDCVRHLEGPRVRSTGCQHIEILFLSGIGSNATFIIASKLDGAVVVEIDE
jgi:hypothetical protein